MLGRAFRVGAAKHFGAAGADRDSGGSLADRTAFRNGEGSLSLLYRDALGDDFIGLNDLQKGLAVFPYSQPFKLADVAKGGSADCGSFQLDRLKHRHRSDGRSRTGPLHMVQPGDS